MSKTRNNHYVPQWYQEQFFEPGLKTLAYLDLTPPQRMLPNGRIITERALFDAPTSRAFVQRDLYSTFFGTAINDEIERKLFGSIDARGSRAIRAFTTDDVREWHRHFETLFEFIDIQKIRTPKGLDWLKGQYPRLSQNNLMWEMQSIRMMHCTIWSEGVREIVSAETSDIKFIVSDHPVTIYNHAYTPDSNTCAYPMDPSIALKGSQTIFPLSRDYCLIFTNLEYARDANANPIERRTSPRNYRRSMTRTDAFIRSRKLNRDQVAQINLVLKLRARRYIAAGQREWLFPENMAQQDWQGVRDTLAPPSNELWHFGGEIYARFDSGHVQYQDEFGRTEKPREFLQKNIADAPKGHSPCPCGSGRPFSGCCQDIPVKLRPTWTEASIRERNLMLLTGIANVLKLDGERDWLTVRRELTDEQIKTIYLIFESLWPLETDILQLLPKPDGRPRAVYTGAIHPNVITEHAIGAGLYFGQLLVEHPFVHAGILNKEYSPVENPKTYRQEFLKSVMFMFTVRPLIVSGLINLIPDPCIFDAHLRQQMFAMAKSRLRGITPDPHTDSQFKRLFEEDFKRGLMSLPVDALKRQFAKTSQNLTEAELDDFIQGVQTLKEADPLAPLHEDTLDGGKEGGQLNMMKLAPNFEMAMYIAQATGAYIVTDSPFRWAEIAAAGSLSSPTVKLTQLQQSMQGADFLFLQGPEAAAQFFASGACDGYPQVMSSAFDYLSSGAGQPIKPNFESGLNARFKKLHEKRQKMMEKSGAIVRMARLQCLFPADGIQENTINRLLLMSSSEFHLANVPMAFFIVPRS
jgi:hypothetical protein